MIKLSFLLFFAAGCANYSVFGNYNAASTPVTEICMQCLCQSMTGCNQAATCDSSVCGMFAITKPYWYDAGSPTVDGGHAYEPYDNRNCINDPHCRNCTLDPYCSARAIQAYMTRYQRDCNGDGKIDCYDYMAIHRNGPNACTGSFNIKAVHVFYQCLASFAAQRPCSCENQEQSSFLH